MTTESRIIHGPAAAGLFISRDGVDVTNAMVNRAEFVASLNGIDATGHEIADLYIAMELVRREAAGE